MYYMSTAYLLTRHVLDHVYWLTFPTDVETGYENRSLQKDKLIPTSTDERAASLRL